jgi:hypothetical protein
MDRQLFDITNIHFRFSFSGFLLNYPLRNSAKEKSLCALCASSKAGGEPKNKE